MSDICVSSLTFVCIIVDNNRNCIQLCGTRLASLLQQRKSMTHLVMAVPLPLEVAASHGIPIRRGRYRPMTAKVKEFSFRKLVPEKTAQGPGCRKKRERSVSGDSGQVQET